MSASNRNNHLLHYLGKRQMIGGYNMRNIEKLAMRIYERGHARETLAVLRALTEVRCDRGSDRVEEPELIVRDIPAGLDETSAD